MKIVLWLFFIGLNSSWGSQEYWMGYVPSYEPHHVTGHHNHQGHQQQYNDPRGHVKNLEDGELHDLRELRKHLKHHEHRDHLENRHHDEHPEDHGHRGYYNLRDRLEHIEHHAHNAHHGQERHEYHGIQQHHDLRELNEHLEPHSHQIPHGHLERYGHQEEHTQGPHDLRDHKHDVSLEHRHHHVHIERPCDLHDVNCIRRTLAHFTGCIPTHGPGSDAYYLKSASMDIPNSNLTLTITNAELKGLHSGKIKEFYINKNTDALVLEVLFGSIVVFSPKTVISYHRRGHEPVEVEDFTIIEFKKISLTLTIRPISNIKHAVSHVFAFLYDANIPLKTGPKLQEISKGLTPEDLRWVRELPLSVKEAMVSQAPLYMETYLRNNICDFVRH